jgi:hypothetical protein
VDDDIIYQEGANESSTLNTQLSSQKVETVESTTQSSNVNTTIAEETENPKFRRPNKDELENPSSSRAVVYSQALFILIISMFVLG